ncbi:uncharacterized protein FA14DRAFT_170442 [Meira miltonrushii]|uniref:Uncharacterized protein n=1 Tax=Meira miltonrushii TaxID=1280837 RepID=A0A316VML1_9BASI|nr:uncharacterized protein FA14DRAFT_170442 [Meira miltonrushii]PWN37643.1 hypothetical protein FA14DRAFT_170442 [Meira miltonrushii]
MKDPSGSTGRPLREPRSTLSLRNISSPSLVPFDASSSKPAAGADAFDVIVQASNPSHPQHAAWVERYGGSIRNTRKSLDGSSTSYQAAQSSTSRPPSLRRSRSKTASKVGTSHTSTTPNAKSRPALNDVMMVPDASVWTLLANQGEATAESERSQNRRQASALEKSADEANVNKSHREGSGRIRTSSQDIRSDATVGASSVKTSATERGQRRKRKKEKGKGRAAAPPVPPPRTTSHAAYHEQAQDALSPNGGEGEASTSPTSLPYLSKASFDASTSPINLSPRLADDARLRHGNDRMGSIDERRVGIQSPSLLSPMSASAFPLRQSSVDPELPQGSPASTASSPPPTRTMFGNLTHSLPGRRSVDFRLPDDDVMKLRQESAKTPRKGLNAIFSPLRGAVAARRADKQAAAAAPLQSEAKKPLPILRVATPPRASVDIPQRAAPVPPPRASIDILQRTAPVPPPRSPLRRSPNIPQEENGHTGETLAGQVQERKESPPVFVIGKNSAPNTQVTSGSGISQTAPAVNAIVHDGTPSVVRSQAKESSTPSMQTTNSSDTTARSQKTFVSLPKSASHGRSFSMDTEDGQEFHDAVSDEGGLGSSDDAMPSNTSATKKRRSRHKSIEDVNAARLQAKEAALNEPLPDSIKQGESTEFDLNARHRRDSSASDDMIPPASRKNSLRRKVSKKQIKTPATKKDVITSPMPNSPRVEQPDDRANKHQSHRQSAATITNSNSSKKEAGAGVGELDGRRKTVTQSSVDEGISQPFVSIDSEQAVPKELPEIPNAEFTPTPTSLENGFQQLNLGFSKSQSSRDIAESYRASHRKAAEKASIDYKQLPLPPPPPPSLPSSPVDETLKRQIAHQRSYSRMMNQSQSSSNTGKISGVFSRMRKDKTPSFSHFPGSDSHSTSLSGSTSQLNLISPSQSPVQDDRNSGVGLGIDTVSMQSSKGTNTSDQHFPSSPSPQQPVRSPSGESGWRNRLPSFSASRAAKAQKGEKGRTDSNQQQPPAPPPIPRQPSSSQMQRQQLLYEAVAHSMSDNSMVQKTVPPSPTIHKTLSPALLREERHEADEVGSFIGSEEAEEERLADSRRGTWNSFSNFELAPNKVYDASGEMSNSSQPPTIDIQGPSIPKSNTTPSNLTSGSFSSPITPQINEPPNSRLRASRSFSPDFMNLSMTARRLSRSSSNPKFQMVPQALDLSPGKANNLRRHESPSDGMEFEPYDDRTSPFLGNSPAIHDNNGKEAIGSLSFPSSPGQLSIGGNGNESKRNRNLSIGSTLLGNITGGGNNNGNPSNTIKPRSSFAMDRDRSPVVNQAWADLPPSPSPRSSAVRKFFASAAKSPLRPGKIRTTSINTLMSPGRPSFQAGSPNDVAFPVSPALPSGQSSMFADVWKQESPSPRTNGNAHAGMPSGSSFNSTSGYPLTQSASTSSLQQVSQDYSSQSSSPIAQLRQVGIPRGMPSQSLHSSTSLNDSLHKEWIAHNGSSSALNGGGTGGSSINAESIYSNQSSRNITSQRMIDSSQPQIQATNEADLQAFGRMLRESAKEDAQRVRQIAKRSVSANNTPRLP